MPDRDPGGVPGSRTSGVCGRLRVPAGEDTSWALRGPDGLRAHINVTLAPAYRVRTRVLVVEDRVRLAALLRRGLQEEGYAVDVATCGPEAVWMATEKPYDEIVLHVMLPGFDGFEVCRRLRHQAAGHRW